MKIGVIFGTRPELIKVAPIIWELQKRLPCNDLEIICTGQHKEILIPLLEFFKIKVSKNFEVMAPNQSLSRLLGRLLNSFDEVFEKKQYNLIIGQGDTTSVLAAGLSSFQRRIPFAHIEAGLRSNDLSSPFPEESNRVLVSRLAKYHFCPTVQASDNLLKEGIDSKTIYITGNTVIDTLLHTKNQLKKYVNETGLNKKRILVTIHRRENHGERLLNICSALKEIALNNEVDIIFLVHPNPNIKKIVYQILSKIKNIYLCEPLDYSDMVLELMKSYFIITDSGGIQEEAPALGKPILIAREETERQEIVQQGGAVLVGSNVSKIVMLANRLLNCKEDYQNMVLDQSPFGKGNSAKMIVDILVSNKTSDK